MRTGAMKLGKILDIPKWQLLQDSLAEVTGLAIITVDYKGIPITRHSGRRPFCGYVREQPQLAEFCQKCDSRGGLEAVRIGRPYLYLCHCQIVDVAIPIILDDRYVGAIMAGQIKPAPGAGVPRLERILHSPADWIFSSEELRRLYAGIPTMPAERLSAAVKMLSDLSNYIVEEAMNKNLVLDMYERVVAVAGVSELAAGQPLQAVESIRKDLGEAVTSAYIKSDPEERVLCANRTLQPAFDYMLAHKAEMLRQQKAAALCHISAGHFSRLFIKETGEPFSAFYARQKVAWSKQLLEKTELTITQISDELGFSDPGYFIKQFRKYEGITPAVYRRYLGGG